MSRRRKLPGGFGKISMNLSRSIFVFAAKIFGSAKQQFSLTRQPTPSALRQPSFPEVRDLKRSFHSLRQVSASHSSRRLGLSKFVQPTKGFKCLPSVKESSETAFQES